MSLLANITSDDSIANEKDTVGNSGPVDSGVYEGTVSLAYVKTAASGAVAIVVGIKTDSGREVRQELWVQSGKDKGGKNFYEKDGQKHYLPGYLLANSLCLLGVGKELSQMDIEDKVVKLYSYEAKAEVPTKVPMLTELIGAPIVAGIIKQTVDKKTKDDNGDYQPTGETRDENEFDKFFRARDRMTTAEIRAKAEEATFVNTWADKWAGKVRMKASGTAAAGTAGAPKAAGAAAASKKPTTSLFA